MTEQPVIIDYTPLESIRGELSNLQQEIRRLTASLVSASKDASEIAARCEAVEQCLFEVDEAQMQHSGLTMGEELIDE